MVANKVGKDMRDLTELRLALDAVDQELVALFEKRMAISREVALAKIQLGKPVLDESREAQVLKSRCAMLQDASLAEATEALYRQIMALSRQEQEKLLGRGQDA